MRLKKTLTVIQKNRYIDGKPGRHDSPPRREYASTPNHPLSMFWKYEIL
jgi:hypothetical protein